MRLSDIDIRILHLVELQPTITTQELARRAGVSWITADRHLKKLRKEGVLSDPVAVFDPSALGLQRHVVLMGAGTEEQLRGLEVACDLHPYTHYRARVYGPFPGLFSQFDVPPGSTALLEEFLQGLSDLGLAESTVVRASTGHRAHSPTNLEAFDLKTRTWEYSWEEWGRAIASADPTLPPRPSPRPDSLSLSEVDLEILRALTANANIPQSELQRELSLSQSTTSRKVLRIMREFIESVRAQIDRAQFDVVSTKLLYAPGVDEATCGRVFNAFSSPSVPPFPLAIDLLEGGDIMVWGRMPPSHEHSLFYTLWQHLPRLRVFTVDTVGQHSCMYWFYPKNYDTSQQAWRADHDWMVDTPLSALETKLRRSG